ncbi:hypothetical protein [Bradyrhizobium sp. BR 1433]|uniref:hypothetical protein n=1 Tax=Bradyrhizobium sp. BR 1433 TaxID=3447967 RepID=UPI003EE61A76
MISIRMPLWLRVVSLVGVILLCTAAGLYGYRWYSRPVTLTLAVGSIDGEAAGAMTAVANQLASDGASVRLKVIDTGTAVESGKQFAAGAVDLAAVRGDVGDLSKAEAIVVLSHMTVLSSLPPVHRSTASASSRARPWACSEARQTPSSSMC